MTDQTEWRQILYKVGADMRKTDIESLLFLLSDFIPQALHGNIMNGVELIQSLVKAKKITPTNNELLKKNLKTIGRADLYNKIDNYEKTSESIRSQEKMRNKFSKMSIGPNY